MGRHLVAALLVIGTVATGVASGGTVLTYEFIQDQAFVHRVGGFTGGGVAFAAHGGFQLRVDRVAGTAFFKNVDATFDGPPGVGFPRRVDDFADGDTEPLPEEGSVAEQFHLTELVGTFIDDNTIEFVEAAPPQSQWHVITIQATFEDDLVHLTGRDGYPVADSWAYELHATAALVPEPATLSLLALGFLVGARRRRRR